MHVFARLPGGSQAAARARRAAGRGRRQRRRVNLWRGATPTSLEEQSPRRPSSRNRTPRKLRRKGCAGLAGLRSARA
eukprot:13919423-Alexandrium_andersonii.AAC.1